MRQKAYHRGLNGHVSNLMHFGIFFHRTIFHSVIFVSKPRAHPKINKPSYLRCNREWEKINKSDTNIKCCYCFFLNCCNFFLNSTLPDIYHIISCLTRATPEGVWWRGRGARDLTPLTRNLVEHLKREANDLIDSANKHVKSDRLRLRYVTGDSDPDIFIVMQASTEQEIHSSPYIPKVCSAYHPPIISLRSWMKCSDHAWLQYTH